MNFASIKYNNVANGPGVRTVLFVSGCTHHCKECFQPETWNFNYGELFTSEIENAIIESLKSTYISGLTLLGGEPFEPENRKVLIPFLKKVRERHPDKSIWAYSGYTYEQLTSKEKFRCGDATEMLELIDVLVDGEFILDKKNISLAFRGSSNQRIIDIQSSLKNKDVIEYSL